MHTILNEKTYGRKTFILSNLSNRFLVYVLQKLLSLSLSLSLSVGIFFLCFSLFLLELVCCISIFSRVCIIHFFQGQSTFVGRLFLKVLQVYQGYREIYFGRFLGYKNQIGSSNSSLKRSFNS